MRLRAAKAQVFAILGFCLASGASYGQVAKGSDIAYVYPAGGKRGTVFEVTVGGQHLAKMNRGLVSGDGVKATVTGYTRPLSGKRFAEFRESIAEHRKEKKDSMQMMTGDNQALDIPSILQEDGATEEEIAQFYIMQKQRNDPKRQDNNQLVEMVTLKVEVAPDAAKGPRTLRLFGNNGISNPLSFFVGDFSEERKPPPTEAPPATPPAIQFPVVLNGQIMPGQNDRYAFRATKGERLVFVAQARDLIPYLADAVPGWFQAVLTVFDSKGNELASAQSARFSPDPVLDFPVKESGDYLLEIRDTLHRGREDFVYRITAGRLPFVTGVFPLGGKAGSETTVEVSGWNLQPASLKVPSGEGIQTLPQLARGFATTDVSFVHDTTPEIFAVEPDNDPSHAAMVKIPATVNGRIESHGDADVFAVNCKKGEPLVFEVFARRLDSPLDSFLRITDTSGKQLAYCDDREDPGAGLLTHHADARIDFDPPSDGLVYVLIGDAQRKGGSDFSYRLRIDRPRPDFDLRVVPSGVTGAPGTPSPVTVYAFRKDGFTGDIHFSATTKGFSISGGCIPAGCDSVNATLTFPDTPTGKIEPVEITGTAEISGSQVTRKAVPADDMLQAFFYHHLVPTPQLLAYSMPEQPAKKPIRIAQGTAKITSDAPGLATVLLPPSFPKDGMKAELKNAPDGISIEGLTPSADGIQIAFRADAKKVKPGTRGNLLVELSTARLETKGEKKEMKRWSMGLLPAIPFQLAAE